MSRSIEPRPLRRGHGDLTRTVTDPDWCNGIPVTLATFGQVPDGVRDQLPF